MQPDQQPNLATELALLLLLAFLWGASYPLIKIAVETIPPVTLIAVRVAIAAALLSLVVCWRRLAMPRDGKTWRAFFVQACFNSILSWTLLAWGQQFVDSGLAGILNSTSPIFVFLITLLITRHEAVSAGKLFGAVMGLVGVTIIIGPGVLAGLGRDVIAQLAVLAGAVCYAGAAIYGRRFSGLPAVVTAAATMICATLCLVPLAVVIDRPWTVRPSVESAVVAVAGGVFSTALAMLLYFRLVRTLGSMGVASQSYLRTGVAVAIGVLLLGEPFTWPVGLGLAAVVVGVAAINGQGRLFKARRRPPRLQSASPAIPGRTHRPS